VSSAGVMDKRITYWRVLANNRGEQARFLCDEHGKLVEPTPEAVNHLKALLSSGCRSVITRGQ